MNTLYQWKSTSPLATRLRRLETGDLRLRRGNFGPITGPFTRFSNDSIDPVNASINLTKSGVMKLGAVPPTVNTNGFAYTATTTSITWYWDGTNGSMPIIIRRADSTMTVVPQGSITITGLSAATDYYFFPFWTPNNRCTIGFVQGTVGDPQIAFVLADLNDPNIGPAAAGQQALQDREPLTSGAMIGSTPAAGTGGGSAGGGGDPHGGGGCVMSGTDIVPLGDQPYHVEVIPETDWLRVEAGGRMLSCTHDHPLFDPRKGKTAAEFIKLGELVIMDTGEQRVTGIEEFRRKCTKHKVIMPEGHLFWAAGFLSHNSKQNPR